MVFRMSDGYNSDVCGFHCQANLLDPKTVHRFLRPAQNPSVESY